MRGTKLFHVFLMIRVRCLCIVGVGQTGWIVGANISLSVCQRVVIEFPYCNNIYFEMTM